MKLFLAISGDTKDRILESLYLALEEPELFLEDNCTVDMPEGEHLDYQWVDETGDAFLADWRSEGS